MRFLSIYKTAERSVPPSQEEIAKMGKPALLEVCASLGAKTLASGLPDCGNDLVEEGMKGGFLLAVEGCLPSALGARVRLSNGTLTLTDGRFTESKEVIGGLAILRADSKEEAIEIAKQFLCEAGKGECKLRQLFEADQNTQAQKAPKS